jgi:hypothetical protein
VVADAATLAYLHTTVVAPPRGDADCAAFLAGESAEAKVVPLKRR